MPKLVHAVEGGGPMWWCPACGCAHGGFAGWALSGTEDRPTIQPSYLVRWTKCDGYEEDGSAINRVDVVCHASVVDGRICYHPDSNHKLSGLTVDMEAF